MPRTHRLLRLVSLVAALAAALAAAGCGTQKQPEAVPSGRPPVPYVVRVTTVTGRLPAAQRNAVRSRVATVIHNWWEEAYLVPGRTDVFGAFTPGAAKLARRDADLMSDAHRAVGAEVRRQALDLDVLAVRQRAQGVTARLHLVYDRGGHTTSRCGVGGTVSLIPVHGSWRIFGYDVTHTCRPRKAGS